MVEKTGRRPGSTSQTAKRQAYGAVACDDRSALALSHCSRRNSRLRGPLLKAPFQTVVAQPIRVRPQLLERVWECLLKFRSALMSDRVQESYTSRRDAMAQRSQSWLGAEQTQRNADSALVAGLQTAQVFCVQRTASRHTWLR